MSLLKSTLVVLIGIFFSIAMSDATASPTRVEIELTLLKVKDPTDLEKLPQKGSPQPINTVGKRGMLPRSWFSSLGVDLLASATMTTLLGEEATLEAGNYYTFDKEGNVLQKSDEKEENDGDFIGLQLKAKAEPMQGDQLLLNFEYLFAEFEGFVETNSEFEPMIATHSGSSTVVLPAGTYVCTGGLTQLEQQVTNAILSFIAIRFHEEESSTP